MASLHAHSKSRRDIARAADLSFIKDLIQEHSPHLFDEITIIDEERSTHYLVEVDRIYYRRSSWDVRFGIDNVDHFQDNFITTNSYLSVPPNRQPFKEEMVVSNLPSKAIPKPSIAKLNLPIEKNNKGIATLAQPIFTIPAYNAVIDCLPCDTKRYVTCRNCDGTHKLACELCIAKGEVDCPDCHSTARVDCPECSGRGETKCRNCHGTERVNCRSCKGTGKKGDAFCRKCSGGKVSCSDCHRGYVKCRSGFLSSGCGGSGKVDCHRCHKTGNIQCPSCKGNRYFVCKQCYGDRLDSITFGKVDCESCKAKGYVGLYTFVTTEIEHVKGSGLVSKEPLPDAVSEVIYMQKTASLSSVLAREHYPNEISRDRHDDITLKLVSNGIKESLVRPGKLVTEQLFFEAIPVSIVEYQHTLTNKKHKLALLGYDDAPQLVLLSDPREGLDHVSKIKEFFRKTFKTKVYRNKVDSRNEIILLIYLAKVDGVIEEREKQFILNAGKNLTDFTKEEQDEMFSLMKLTTLPPLDKKYTRFSSLKAEKKVSKLMSDMIYDDEDIESVDRDLSYYLTMI
jgi:hypothetical protein